MAITSPKILIFDSGLGGLSIFKVIRQQYPSCQLSYCTDNAAFPYGTKAEPELIDRVSLVLSRLNQLIAPDIIVIACNTASTVALPKVRSLIKAPVVGVVPAIKPASAIAQSPNIGLLATPATVNRRYTQSLIDEFAPGFQWIKVGSSELVELAEKKMYGTDISLEAVKKIVAPLANYSSTELDTVVLACTHFPLVKDELKKALPGIINWVDSAEGIAKRVGVLLQEKHLLNIDHTPGSIENHQIVFTRKPEESGVARLLAEYKFGSATTLSV